MAPSYHEIASPYPSPQACWHEDAKGFLECDATRFLKCAWTDVPALISYLYSQAGQSYPHPDGTPEAIVRDVKPKGFGRAIGSGSLMTYSHAILEVRYSTRGPRWFNNMMVEEKLEPTNLVQHLDHNQVMWNNGGIVRADEMPSKFILGFTHTLTVSRAPSVPSDLLAYVGRVNAGVKTCITMPIWFGPQTVLCVAPSITSKVAYDYTLRYVYTYKHLVNPFGWNKGWNIKTGYDTLKNLDGTPAYLYPPTW